VTELPIENCGGCGKKTEPHEWLPGLPSVGLSQLLTNLVRFICSACGHQSYSGILEDDKWNKT
jgi:hypothetical protein